MATGAFSFLSPWRIMYFNLGLLIFIAPAILLAVVAQMMVSAAYSRCSRVEARMSGFAAARKILDAAGLTNVGIVEIPGRLSDHYDPRQRVLRLSSDVYHNASAASVGIAAHEAGHALQHATKYLPLGIRSAAVPAASFGSSIGGVLLAVGLATRFPPLFYIGVILFGCVVFFQLINLPVEFDASARAKKLLIDLDIIDSRELPDVKKVLNAAALTYVAATLTAILTLLYYVTRFVGRRR